jgi:gluconolactonase
MSSKALAILASCLLGSTLVLAQGGAAGQAPTGGAPAAQPATPPADTVAPDIPGVVAAGTKVQLIKEAFQGAQGATMAPDGSLLLTERMANRFTKIDKDGNISSYMENTSAANSFAIDTKGRVIAVQWMPAQVGELAPVTATLADKCEGHAFGRPNDLVIDKKGGVYFTDDLGIPASGVKPGVYYVKPNGGTLKIADDINRPNGLILSRDEAILYVDDTNGDSIRAFDIQADGSVRNERILATIIDGVRKTDTGGLNSGADGMAIDAAGRLYVSSNAGVQVFSPQGQYLGSIPIPRQTNNLAFAGPGKKTLYVLAGNAVYKIPMLAEGYKGRAK